MQFIGTELKHTVQPYLYEHENANESNSKISNPLIPRRSRIIEDCSTREMYLTELLAERHLSVAVLAPVPASCPRYVG